MAVSRCKPKIKADKHAFRKSYVKTKRINRSSAVATGGTRF